MANNTIQLKRSSVAGKTPNTSTLATGELAINITDKKLFSSDGTNIFEPAGNVTDINITGGIKANGSFGTSGYTLSTNGSGIYWAPSTGGGPVINTIPSNIRNIVNTSVNTTASVIDTANATGISTIEYIVSARDNINSNFKSSKVVITSNGTVSYIMEYAIVASNDSISVCSFSTNIASGNIRLFATGDSNDTDISLQRVVLGSATEAGDIAASVIVDSVTNTAINVSAAANSVKLAYDTAISAYSNAVSYTDTKIGTANTAMVANAVTAYTNATIFAANISNVNSGTLSEARLPYRMNQNVRTTDNAQFNDLTVTGNLTLSGNTLIVGANNLIVSDAVISLHTPANLAALTSNDGRNIGLAFHYYDTEDKHALLYRDNTTGYLQYHTDGGDPISNSNPTGNNFGTIQAATFWAGNSSIYATVNATNYTGTSNNASNLGGVAAASYVNTSGAYTISGVHTYSGNVVLQSGLSANGGFGTAGQVLTSNGTTGSPYWSSVAAGVNTAAQYTWSNTQTFANNVYINNNKGLNFQTTNSSAYASFIQQSDDNFVFYTTNASYGQRAIWSIYANNNTANLRFATQTTFAGNIDLNIVAVYANGSPGTAGQILASNGTSTYWVSPGAASVNTAAQFSWSNLHTFQANVNFTGNNITVVTNTGSVMFGGAGDTNWRIGRNTNATTKWRYSNSTLDILAANSNLEGVVIGNPLVGGATYFETGHLGTYIASNVTIGNTTSNVTINSTSFSGTSNNASYLNGQLPAYYTNATNITTGTLPYAQIPANVINTTADFTRTGITTFSANVVLGSSGLSSNGSFGTAGQILASNGTATYWASTIAPRVNTATSTATLAWNSDNYEQYQLTALATICTISADSGTPVNGRKIIFRLEDNGTARALTWTNGVSNSFRAIGTTLPTATVANKTVYVGAIYNSTDSRWDVIAVAQEA